MAAGFRPDPLGELERSPDFLAVAREEICEGRGEESRRKGERRQERGKRREKERECRGFASVN